MVVGHPGRAEFNYMGRALGAKHRMCRRVGERLCNNDRCPVTRRHAPPGAHGPKGYGKLTEFGTQLREKQKAKYMYGLMEKQFRNYYEAADKQVGNSAENFLKKLETRLDNVVFRLGFAKTRAQARQLVSHGKVMVNGKRVTIPSFQVKIGEEISLKPNAKTPATPSDKAQVAAPSWLSVDLTDNRGKVLSQPAADDFPKNLNMTLVVEYYSR
jgi:small subunit ribosomal protein S4